jgi:hypothetical protein
VELVAGYEQARAREPGLEVCWRLTTALGISLETFLQLAEREAGLRLLQDVRLPAQVGQLGRPVARVQTGNLAGRGQGRPAGGTGNLAPPAPREHVEKSGDADQLAAFVEQLRTRREGGGNR